MGLMLTRLNGGWMLAVGIIGLVVALVSGIRAYQMLKRSTDKANEERRLAAFMRASASIAAARDGTTKASDAAARTADLRSPGVTGPAKPTLSNLIEKKRGSTEEERFREFLEREKK